MVRVGREGPLGSWRKGGVANLVRLADDVGANETYVITQILEGAIRAASERIGEHWGMDGVPVGW